jgi:hypothetical protein
VTSLVQLAAAACAAASAAGAPCGTTAPDSIVARDTAAAAVARPDGPRPRLVPLFAPDSAPQPRRSVEYSDAYYRRLTVHRWASYTMLPLFAAQYVLGDRILDQKTDAYAGVGNGVDPAARRRHQVVAGGVATLFAVNTVTGVWNAIEARGDANGRARRSTHVLLMLAADAGFVATGLIASRASDQGPPQARTHRTVALGSMGVATAGAAVMWFRGDR